MRLKKNNYSSSELLKHLFAKERKEKFKRIYIQLFLFAHVHEISRGYLRKFQKKERKKWKSYR